MLSNQNALIYLLIVSQVSLILLASKIIFLIRVITRKKNEEEERKELSSHTTPMSYHLSYPLSSATRILASAIHQKLNDDYYMSLLSGISEVLARLGYRFGTDASRQIALPPSVLHEVAAALTRTQINYMRPFATARYLAKSIEQDLEDSYSQSYLRSILAASADFGHYVELIPLQTTDDTWTSAADLATG